ncbi:MAG: hypothetical protein RLZZ579_142 [Actinomycetota bacterium]
MSDAAAQRRAKQTVRNLFWAILATVGVVALVVLGVPRDDSSRLQTIDSTEVSQAAREDSGLPVILLESLPEGWVATQARWSAASAKGEADIFLGLVGPDNQYIGVTQVFEFEDAWFEEETNSLEKTGEYDFGNYNWSVLEPSGSVNLDEVDPMWGLFINRDVVLITGSAKAESIQAIAKMIDAQLFEAYEK